PVHSTAAPESAGTSVRLPLLPCWLSGGAPMAQPDADRNLLFGILALQMDFIRRDDLIAAMNAWVLDKDKSLGQILHEHGHLNPERLRLLDALVQEHVRAHGNDPGRSLAAVGPLDWLSHELDPSANAKLPTSGNAALAAPGERDAGAARTH